MKFGITKMRAVDPKLTIYKTSTGKESLSELDAMVEETNHIFTTIKPSWDKTLRDTFAIGVAVGINLCDKINLATTDTYRAALLLARIENHAIEDQQFEDEIKRFGKFSGV